VSTDAFNRAIAFILPHEEEFARGHWGDENFVVTENVSGDAGGLTKYGIDAASHPGVNIAQLTRDQAIAIYHTGWQRHGLDGLPAKLAIACFDVWVNGGYAVKWLQTALNQARPAGTTPLVVDGSLGPATLSSAALCNQDAVTKIFLEERDARFEALAAAHPSDKQFLAGWEQRDRDLTAFLQTV
jgi:lysozyme family protein